MRRKPGRLGKVLGIAAGRRHRPHPCKGDTMRVQSPAVQDMHCMGRLPALQGVELPEAGPWAGCGGACVRTALFIGVPRMLAGLLQGDRVGRQEWASAEGVYVGQGEESRTLVRMRRQ